MYTVKKLFACVSLSILCILNSVYKTYGDCDVQLSQDPLLRPDIYLKIGSKKVQLLINDTVHKIEIHNNQKIEARCSNKFKEPEKETNILDVECRVMEIFVFGRYYSRSINLECSSLQWNLYEATNNFVWCPTNVTSYLLGRSKEDSKENYEFLAAVCYDTHNLSFKSVYYKIAPQHENNMHLIIPSNLYKPSLEVKYLKETFTTKSIDETEYYNQDIQDWLKFAQYDYKTIIQNPILYKEFNYELGALLDLAWWPNLRLGNWKRYERALMTHVEEDQEIFNVLAGVSGVAAAPIIEMCKTNYTLKDLVSSGYQEIPKYIWNYLRSASNTSDAIVVIGFNSPFYEFYSEEDVIFCRDKCHEITWLKNVSTTFHYNALGIMFCCSVDEVYTSQRLNGFPQIVTEEKQTTTETNSDTFDTLHHHKPKGYNFQI